MAYDFTYDFEVETTLGFAEGTIEITYSVSGGEVFIKNDYIYKGKLYNADGNVICDFVAQKHHELGAELHKNLYNDIVFACIDDYRKNGA